MPGYLDALLPLVRPSTKSFLFVESIHIPLGLRGNRLVNAGVFTLASVFSYLFPDLFVDLFTYAFALRIHHHRDDLH